MKTPSPSDPDYESWLDAQVEEMLHQEMLDNSVHCPSCGRPMWRTLKDGSKPNKVEGYYWWICWEETCGKKWESHRGELRERK